MKQLLVSVLLVLEFVIGIIGGPYPKVKNFDGIESSNRIPDTGYHQTNPYSYTKQGKLNDELETSSEFWHQAAHSQLGIQLDKKPNTNKAKNIIIFLGDGMSHPSVAAARMLLGGEEQRLYFENFPFTASSKTYCFDLQVADSACTSTAYLSGVKGRGETIGLNGQAKLADCLDGMDPEKRTESIASWAMNAGKDAGIVTTTRVSHASPAGAFAHVALRYWENDLEIRIDGCDSDYVDDVTEQLVHGDVGKKLKVIFGCGSRQFLNRTLSEHGNRGYREDGKNLLEDWKQMNPSRVYVNNREDLMKVDPKTVSEVLGLFDSSHCTYNLNVKRDGLERPSLKEMTERAIDILSENENGFFLFVEGGRIDHGHHETRAKYALDETLEFAKAIEAAVAKVNLEETLIVVTADHAHAMTISGYAPRGNDIFGFAGTGADGLPYMTLSYANGPGFYAHYDPTGGRVNASTLDRSPVNFEFPATLPRSEETHGGDDVGIWAIGPWAHLFQGTVEQNVIPHIMAYASCIGNGMKMCDN